MSDIFNTTRGNGGGGGRICHSMREIATESVILVQYGRNRAGWQVQMASIELWIPWLVHGPHSCKSVMFEYQLRAKCFFKTIHVRVDYMQNVQ